MLRLLTILLTLAGTHAQGLIINPYAFGVTCDTLTANTAVFDGTNDYLRNSADGLTAVTDGPAFALSFWVRFDDDATTRSIFNITASGAVNVRFNIYRDSSERLQVQGRNSANTVILNASSSVNMLEAADGWVHVYVAVNLADAGQRHIYFNSVEDAGVSWSTYTNDNIDFNVNGTASPRSYIGIHADESTQKLDGDLVEFWFNDAYFNDVTKFSCNGRPLNLGATGSTPTGGAPAVYLSRNGSGNSWATDSSGNGNTFTVTGTLGTTTPP